MKCPQCGADCERVGTWAGLWIMACTKCLKTYLRIVYTDCGGG